MSIIQSIKTKVGAVASAIVTKVKSFTWKHITALVLLIALPLIGMAVYHRVVGEFTPAPTPAVVKPPQDAAIASTASDAKAQGAQIVEERHITYQTIVQGVQRQQAITQIKSTDSDSILRALNSDWSNFESSLSQAKK